MTFGSAAIEYELRRHGLCQHFAAIVTSADYGLRKPHPFPFRAMAGRLRVEAKRCWYIGDRADIDVFGSHAAGMKGIWLNRSGAIAPPNVAPHGELRQWADFSDLWKNLR